jgi:hypothetical protein
VLTIDNEDFETARELAPNSLPYVDMKIVYDGIEVDLTQSEFNQMMDEALYKIVKERTTWTTLPVKDCDSSWLE